MSHHLIMFGGHWFIVILDIKYLMCHVTSQNCVTFRVELFIVYHRLDKFVAIGIVVVEI